MHMTTLLLVGVSFSGATTLHLATTPPIALETLLYCPRQCENKSSRYKLLCGRRHRYSAGDERQSSMQTPPSMANGRDAECKQTIWNIPIQPCVALPHPSALYRSYHTTEHCEGCTGTNATKGTLCPLLRVSLGHPPSLPSPSPAVETGASRMYPFIDPFMRVFRRRGIWLKEAWCAPSTRLQGEGKNGQPTPHPRLQTFVASSIPSKGNKV